MKTRRGLLLICLLCCFIWQAHASEDRALFWKLTSGLSTVYLLGSIHYADSSFYPLRSEIEQAFESAGALVVEVDIEAGDQDEVGRLIRRRGQYSGNETIRDHVSTQTYEKLENRLQSLQLPIDLVSKQKPGLLVLTLTAVHAMRLGFDPEHGIDLYFLRKARGNKQILQLETMEEQLNIFLDVNDGELLLNESLLTMDKDEQLLDEMISLWKKGDEAKFYALMFEDVVNGYPAFASIYDRLFYQRNRKMAATIKNYLERGGVYFVVVGAGHLVGEKGIVSLIEKAGYSTTRM